MLKEQLHRIYLYCYAESRNRASALDGTRRVLMQAARGLDAIPDGCPLSVWCFLLLDEDREKPVQADALWRTLALAKNGAATAADNNGSRPRMADHPQLRGLLERYERYVALPRDEEILARAGLDSALSDLNRFLDAQFGEERCADRGRGPGWRLALPTGAWKRSRLLAAGVIVAAVALALILWRTWDGLRSREAVPVTAGVGGAVSPGTPPAATESAATGSVEPGGAEPARTESAASVQLATDLSAPVALRGSVSEEGGSLAFAWETSRAAPEYHLSILTPKLDTLHTAFGLTEGSFRLRASDVGGLHAPGSYLFRVDGMRGAQVVASTGYVPFERK